MLPLPQPGGATITNRIAIALAALLALLLAADFAFQGGAGTLFLARRFTELTRLIAFWR